MFNFNFISGDRAKFRNNEITDFYISFFKKALIYQIVLLILILVAVSFHGGKLKKIQIEIKKMQPEYLIVSNLKTRKTALETELENLNNINKTTRNIPDNLCILTNLTEGNIYFTTLNFEFFRDMYIYDIRGFADKMEDITQYLLKIKEKEIFKYVQLENMKQEKQSVGFYLKLLE